MADNTYKIIEIIGTSELHWADAARNGIEQAGKSLHNLRTAEVTKLDVTINDGKVDKYRVRMKMSFMLAE